MFRKKLDRLKSVFRYGLLPIFILGKLSKLGIVIAPYYWTREGTADIEPRLRYDDEIYDYDLLGPADMKSIAELDHDPELERLYRQRLADGDICIGMKFEGRIAAFFWAKFKETRFMGNPIQLGDDESYLFNMHTFPDFRGKSLAPVLRYKGYAILRDLNITRFYSVTERYNFSSIKFKKKLHAEHLRLCLYVELFKRYRWNWVIREYA